MSLYGQLEMNQSLYKSLVESNRNDTIAMIVLERIAKETRDIQRKIDHEKACPKNNPLHRAGRLA